MARTTVVGLFDNFTDARNAAQDLRDAGFPESDISLVSNNADQTFGEYRTDDGANVGGAVHDTVAGAGKGAMYGGLTALAASLALLLIPGIGPIAAVGPLAAALSGATIGAVGGGLIGGLTGIGVPKEHAEFYNEGIRRGGTLVTVSADETRADEAARILDRYNPIDVDERETYFRNSGYTGYSDVAPHYTPEQITTERTNYAATRAMTPATTQTTTTTPATTGMTAPNNTVNTGETVAVPIVEETLAVGKRQVERGGARIRRYVTETPVTENVTLRDEQVHVDRRPVDRTLSAADLNNAFTEGTIEIRGTGEEAVVTKQARVVEEVIINKEAVKRQQTVSDTVRRTDVDIEELNTGATTTGTTTTGTTGPTTSR